MVAAHEHRGGRSGDWMQVFSGQQFWPMDPRPEEVEIEDIAHALSLQCRFGGHCEAFYSVAQHSVLVSQVCDPDDALWGLLHDAAEAYVVDVPRPLKRFLANYKSIEEIVQDAICKRFDLPEKMPPSVHYADNVLLATEARDLMKRPRTPWAPMPEPLANRLHPWSPAEAKGRFLARFRELTVGDIDEPSRGDAIEVRR